MGLVIALRWALLHGLPYLLDLHSCWTPTVVYWKHCFDTLTCLEWSEEQGLFFKVSFKLNQRVAYQRKVSVWSFCLWNVQNGFSKGSSQGAAFLSPLFPSKFVSKSSFLLSVSFPFSFLVGVLLVWHFLLSTLVFFLVVYLYCFSWASQHGGQVFLLLPGMWQTQLLVNAGYWPVWQLLGIGEVSGGVMVGFQCHTVAVEIPLTCVLPMLLFSW